MFGTNRVKPRLLFLRPFSPGDRAWLLERLAPFYEITQPAAYDEATLSFLVREADVALGARVSSDTLAAAEQLKFLQTPGTGLEQLDLQALAAKGVCVCNSTSHAPQVAEHGVAMLLALMRKAALHDRLLRQGTWYKPEGHTDDGVFQSDPLIGARIGFVGYGNINQSIAKLLSGFDVSVFAHCRTPVEGVRIIGLSELFRVCDAIFVAVPLTDQTRGMIGQCELSAKQPAPYVVNISRAEVIDPCAMIHALAEKRIRGFALDVPYGGDELAGLAEFTRFDNTLLSPHRAGTLRGQSPHLHDVVENLIAFAKGQPLKNIIVQHT